MEQQPLTADQKARTAAAAGAAPARVLFVNVSDQELLVLDGDRVVKRYRVSTSARGTGNREGSCRTPLGVHRVVEKYGQGAPLGRIFVDRLDTGENWDGNPEGDNLVLTRILRLEGLEPGVNRGPGIDSYERYIYIHGTSKESRIGSPLSHGCVVMLNKDVIELFDMTPEGTVVFIDQ